jgi:hypothetical protein
MFWRKKKIDADHEKIDADYELIERKSETGRGYVIRRIRDGQLLDWKLLDQSGHSNIGLMAFAVAGVSFRPDDVNRKEFGLGRAVKLTPEPNNQYDPNAIAVRGIKGRYHAGYVPAELTSTVDTSARAVVMWEYVEGRRRVGLRLLCIAGDTKIALP